MQALITHEMIMLLVGGLALFLFGMTMMTDSLKVIAGDNLKKLLGKLTSNRFNGALTGAVTTMLIQSSSITTVLVVGFISAGLMTLPQAIGVIMGANIGTTITAQIVAFKVTEYAYWMVAIGFATSALMKKRNWKHWGLVLLGLGIVFIGMGLMKDATKPLRGSEVFLDQMSNLSSPFIGILIGAAFTGIIQSSSATTGVIIVLASQGLLSLEGGIALVFGANIGTCITALLASIGKPREAVQAAMVHILFNIAGVVLWMCFIPQFAEFIVWFSEKIAGEGGVSTQREIAHAHTIFNVTNTFLFIWFTGPMASLVRFLIPIKEQQTVDRSQPKYLDEILMQTPSIALEEVRMELGRLGKQALRMVRKAPQLVVLADEPEMEPLDQMESNLDDLHRAIIKFLRRLGRKNLSHSQSKNNQAYLAISNYLENIGDTVVINNGSFARERKEHHVSIPKESWEIIEPLQERVCESLDLVLQAIKQGSRDVAAPVRGSMAQIDEMANEIYDELMERVSKENQSGSEEDDRLNAFRIEADFVEYLRHVHYFVCSIVKIIPETTDPIQKAKQPKPAKAPVS